MKRHCKNRFIVIIVLAGTFCLISAFVYGKDYLSREDAVKAAFPLADKTYLKTIRLNNSQVARVIQQSGQQLNSRFKTFYIAEKNGEIQGYAAVGNTKGKSSIIKYFVAIAPKGAIKRVDILAYRGTKGSEISNEQFTKQFKGKRPNDPIKLGVDIDAMSGATISSRSVTDSVKKLMHIWQEFFGSYVEQTHAQLR